MYKYYNPNPKNRLVDDCVIRAIALLTDQTWDNTYIGITMAGFDEKDMPSSGRAFSKYLRDIGFKRYVIPNTCPDCYTVRDFCFDNPKGNYLLVTDKHVIGVKDGNYYDTWDSGDEVPMYYWQRRK